MTPIYSDLPECLPAWLGLWAYARPRESLALKAKVWDILGGPVAKTPRSRCGRSGLERSGGDQGWFRPTLSSFAFSLKDCSSFSEWV